MKKTFLFFFMAFLFSAVLCAHADPFILEPVVKNLDRPWAVAVIGQGEYLFTLKQGKLLYVNKKKKQRIVYSVGKLAIYNGGQGGLLDLILAPDFKESREIFVTFSEKRGRGSVTALASTTFRGNPPRMGTWKVHFRANNYAENGFHFGSRIVFDQAGHIYMTVGERRQRPRVQALSYHNGKTLRLDRRGNPVKGNPFLGRQSALSEIYSLGHRNSQGMALHPMTGEIWQHEHGPRGGDEINIIKAGFNYGWPLVTHGREYSGAVVGEGKVSATGMAEPFLHWTPSIAPSGMAFYTGEDFPQWKNSLFVGALAQKHLRLVLLDGKKVVGQTVFLKDWQRIRDVRMGQDGFLYVLTDGPDAGLYKVMRKKG